jgi:type I restriction enzyme S subunit
MKDEKKAPKLRFKGFTDEWEQCKLSDISEKSYEKNTDNKYSTVLTNSAECGIVKQRNFFDKDIANSSNISGYYVVRKNYFVYNPRISNQAKFGPINRNKLDETGIMSPLYLVFTVHDINESFLETLFQTTTWHRFMYQNGDTGARADRFAIKDSTFMSMPIKVPTLEEQHKLALAFQKLDHTITLHEEKKRQLERLKNALLQKMFPKNGAKVPELRFAGFADDWEERKLKDVLDISKTKNKAQQYGKVDVLSVSREVGTVNQIKHQGRSFAGSDLSNYKVVQGGELIYTKSPLKGAPYGIFQVATIKGIISPLYAVYTSTDKAYTPFVATALKNDNIATHYLTPLVTKGAKNTINVTDEGALEGKLQFPSILEQKQIFIFFKQLDDTIALHQRKLEKLQELKKGYLQKMFC